MDARYPLLVEILLADARIAGVVDLQEERRRLVDLLNSSETILEVTSAQIFIGNTEKRLESLSVAKSSIRAAIPRETNEHNRIRAIQRTVVGRSATSQGRMAMFMPPLFVEGVAHGPGGATRLKADPSIFTHFFSVTDAEVGAPYGELHDLPVVVVNRDSIVAMSLLAEVFRATDPRTHSNPMDRSVLEELVSHLEADSPAPPPKVTPAAAPNRSFYYPQG